MSKETKQITLEKAFKIGFKKLEQTPLEKAFSGGLSDNDPRFLLLEEIYEKMIPGSNFRDWLNGEEKLYKNSISEKAVTKYLETYKYKMYRFFRQLNNHLAKDNTPQLVLTLIRIMVKQMGFILCISTNPEYYSYSIVEWNVDNMTLDKITVQKIVGQNNSKTEFWKKKKQARTYIKPIDLFRKISN